MMNKFIRQNQETDNQYFSLCSVSKCHLRKNKRFKRPYEYYPLLKKGMANIIASLIIQNTEFK